MPRDIKTRLENLHIRRTGLDAVRSGRLTASFAEDVQRGSQIQESWQRRASTQPYTRYALGAMQAVGPVYTQKSLDEAERVAKQLRDGLSIPVETRLQGSVPLDVHIRGVSDVDLLALRKDFLVYETNGERARIGYYNSTTQTSLSALSELRRESENLLKRRYWGANVDCSGGKCIALSGGSFERPVDVVPAHWHDNVAYQATGQEYHRGVTILDKKVPESLSNLPFMHIKCVHDRDTVYFGGLKKAIRLVKNVKNDAVSEIDASKLPSFDIAALMYHANGAYLQAGFINELCVLLEAQRFFDWCYHNRADAAKLMTPDGLRPVLNTEAKRDGLAAISNELDELAREVAREQGLYKLSPTWTDIHSVLSQASVPGPAA